MLLGFLVSYKVDLKLFDIPIMHASKVFYKLTGVHYPPIYCVIVKIQLNICNEF
jgi:hypothetical protein